MPVPKPAALAIASCAVASAITSCSGNLATPTTGAWKQMGFNLDGKVTTATSTDVCQLVAGAEPAEQDDGQDGIDNSFGENICPILNTLDMPAQCSTGLSRRPSSPTRRVPAL
jgi:hypothetical protein